MDGDPAELSINDLALTGVQARSDLDPQLGDLPADRRSAAYATRRPIERREEPVAGGVQLTAAMASQLSSHNRVVALHDLPPSRIPHLRQMNRRVDDVREENRGQNAVRLRLGPAVCAARIEQEALDLVGDLVDLRQGRYVAAARELDVRRARDALGDVPPLFDLTPRVVCVVQNESRHVDGRQDVANVDSQVHSLELERVTGGDRIPDH